jgi:hypothetical protein
MDGQNIQTENDSDSDSEPSGEDLVIPGQDLTLGQDQIVLKSESTEEPEALSNESKQ